MKKINFKEVAFLLRQSQNIESVNLIGHLKKHSKTKGIICAAQLLYFSLLDKSLNMPDGNNDANWIIKPKSFALPNAIRDWMVEIELEYLLEYFAKSTYKDGLIVLKKSGLIFVDQRNSIHIKFPVSGKMLSPKFAFISILSQKKRAKEEHSNEEKVLDKEESIVYNTETETESESVIGSSINWDEM